MGTRWLETNTGCFSRRCYKMVKFVLVGISVERFMSKKMRLLSLFTISSNNFVMWAAFSACCCPCLAGGGIIVFLRLCLLLFPLIILRLFPIWPGLGRAFARLCRSFIKPSVCFFLSAFVILTLSLLLMSTNQITVPDSPSELCVLLISCDFYPFAHHPIPLCTPVMEKTVCLFVI